MTLLRPFYKEDTQLSKIVYASHIESPGPERINYPSYALIYSPIAELITHLYNQLVGSKFFNVPCHPVHLKPKDSNDYTIVTPNKKLSRMSSDSLVLWMKMECPVDLHRKLAEILIQTREDPQLMMRKFTELKDGGKKKLS